MARRSTADWATGPRGAARPDATGSDGAATARPTVLERVSYRRGDRDDAVEAAIAYEIPDAVSRLAFWIERPSVTVLATDGFERSAVGGYTWQGSVDGPAFEWDGTTDVPTVIVRQPLAGDGPATYGGGTDDWALLLRPRTHSRWRYSGREPRIDREAAVCDAGVAGTQFAFLGEYEGIERRVARGKRLEASGKRRAETRADDDGAAGEDRSGAAAEDRSSAAAEDRSGEDEHLRLVVPGAADLVAAPERILDSLAAASERLDVGGSNPAVTIFVAPTAGVEWAHRGLSLGPDARVNDVAPLAASTNIWVHEYVHTRQDRSATTPATEWLLEATAEYYAATEALERGTVGYPAYREVLERGVEGRSAGAILADPATWDDDAQYRKGALVVAALDRRIRAATSGAETFQSVLRSWARADTFDAAAFADAVEAAGGAAARAAAIAFTQTTATPTCWSAATHAATFDVAPADCGVESAGRDALPIRSRTVDRGAEHAAD